MSIEHVKPNPPIEKEPSLLLKSLLENIDDQDYLHNRHSWRSDKAWEDLRTKKDSLSDERPDFPFLLEKENLREIANFFSIDKEYLFHSDARHSLSNIATGEGLAAEERHALARSIQLACDYINEKDRTRGMLLNHLHYALSNGFL